MALSPFPVIAIVLVLTGPRAAGVESAADGIEEIAAARRCRAATRRATTCALVIEDAHLADFGAADFIL